ncbi:hypothetical protein [Paenibacillus planticolens]|uniref:hypothetical protein n=1 Tax=Paenibacillus planticolens TaxID=2654976 RepID=UPI001490F478|nr:hypothetical protein [Paenibacillus planticolens]
MGTPQDSSATAIACCGMARTCGVPSGERPGAGAIRASGGPLHEVADRELLDER